MNWKAILIGAIGGLLTAIRVDFDAWKRNGGAGFNWSLALSRWIQGGMIGAFSGGVVAVPVEA